MPTAAAFAELRTRAADVFTAELRQTCRLVLTYAGNPQISALLAAPDEVFNGQAFPPPGAASVPGWSNLRELATESSQLLDAPQAAEYAVWQTTAEFRQGVAAAFDFPSSLHLTA